MTEGFVKKKFNSLYIAAMISDCHNAAYPATTSFNRNCFVWQR